MISKNRKNTREFYQKPKQNINRIYTNKKALHKRVELFGIVCKASVLRVFL